MEELKKLLFLATFVLVLVVASTVFADFKDYVLELCKHPAPGPHHSVPEPMLLVQLGLGLLGIRFIGKKFRR